MQEHVLLDGKPVGTNLTLDNLCEAIRFFLKKITEDPAQPVDQVDGLVLVGTPADDTMRTLMELFGGTIRITVREKPAGLQESVDRSPVFGNIIWDPNEPTTR